MTKAEGAGDGSPPDVTPDEVAKWFQDAAKKTPHKGRGRRLPGAGDPYVVDLTHRVNSFARATFAPSKLQLDMRKSWRKHKADRERAQKAATQLASLLPALVDDPLGVLNNGEVSGLITLAAALDAALPSFGEPPRKGRRGERWTSAADRLLPMIMQAWESAGWSGLSYETDGPVLRVAKAAVHAATGDTSVTVAALTQEMKKLRAVAKMKKTTAFSSTTGSN